MIGSQRTHKMADQICEQPKNPTEETIPEPRLTCYSHIEMKINYSKCLCCCSMQELKGKILLKAKKIGGLECVDETLADEVSDDDDVANGETESSENPPAECQKVNITMRGRA